MIFVFNNLIFLLLLCCKRLYLPLAFIESYYILYLNNYKEKQTMKKFLLSLLFAAMGTHACVMAQHGLVGFANYADLGLRGTTGGAGGEIVHVKNRADFEKYAGAEEPYIIILDADLKGFYDYSTDPKQKHDVVSVASNKTIIGGGSGARLDSLGLDIKNQQNIIIRNLKISKADPDAIALRNSHHVWIDHCDLSSQKEENDANDGLLDFTYGSSYLTVSWCKFHDHDKSSICSSGTRNIADYGRQRVTYHHNAFINCTQRNPRIGYGLGHIFNDYNERNTSYAIGMFARAVVNVENCYFKDVKTPFSQMYATSEDDAYWGFLKSEGNVFEGNKGEGNSEGFDVSRYYQYDFAMDDAQSVPGLVAQMGCVDGIESDIIPFPGDGAIGVVSGTVIACGDIEGATDYIYKVGTSPDALRQCDPAMLELQPSTTYYWQVTVDGGEYSGKTSGVFRFTTAPDKATFPTPFDGEQHASLREIDGATSPCVPLNLRWREGFDAQGYTVYMGTDSSLDGADGHYVEAEAWQPGDLRYGHTYYWRVDATTADGSVAPGDVWSFTSDISYAHEGRNEGEHAVRGGLCFPELDNQPSWILASNDSCNVGDQGPGYMSFVWAGNAATYDITTAYFDESSGKGWYGLFVGEECKDSWIAKANNNKMATRVTKDVALAPGDEIRIEFYTEGNMRCRTDYIDIALSSGSSGIENVDSSLSRETRIYSLDGRYVGSDVRKLDKGIYIINSRKVVVSGR